MSVSQSGRSFGSSTVMRKGFDSGVSDVFVKRLHGVSEAVVCHMSVFVVMFLHVRLCVRCARLQNVIVGVILSKQLCQNVPDYDALNEILLYLVFGKGKGKGKAIPLQAWTGPEGYRRLRLPDFKTVGT